MWVFKNSQSELFLMNVTCKLVWQKRKLQIFTKEVSHSIYENVPIAIFNCRFCTWLIFSLSLDVLFFQKEFSRSPMWVYGSGNELFFTFSHIFILRASKEISTDMKMPRFPKFINTSHFILCSKCTQNSPVRRKKMDWYERNL